MAHLLGNVEQDHRAVKRIVRPMLGFKTDETDQRTLAGIELMHMIRTNRVRALCYNR